MGELRTTAEHAVEALGLDFGAVDIMYHENTFYVLEVNTAPGLTRTRTLEAYANEIRRLKEGEG